jgi:hypothetical protein
MHDPYVRLRPTPPTPVDELCTCIDTPPIMLMWALGPNPIHCLRCNGEVEPSGIPLPGSLVDAIAHWVSIVGSILTVELDSGPYERWAQRELLDLRSPVNVKGLSLRQQLDSIRRCYFVLFQPLGRDGRFVVPATCPICGATFQEYARGRLTRLLCETCRWLIVLRMRADRRIAHLGACANGPARLPPP